MTRRKKAILPCDRFSFFRVVSRLARRRRATTGGLVGNPAGQEQHHYQQLADNFHLNEPFPWAICRDWPSTYIGTPINMH
jgi:hypothetical protein